MSLRLALVYRRQYLRRACNFGSNESGITSGCACFLKWELGWKREEEIYFFGLIPEMLPDSLMPKLHASCSASITFFPNTSRKLKLIKH